MFHIDEFTLYRGQIGQIDDTETRINELNRLSKNLDQCMKLDNEEQMCSDILGKSPPPDQKYYILIQAPRVVSSICVCTYNMDASVDTVVSLNARPRNLWVSAHIPAPFGCRSRV
jgi:hypothetical protein